MIIADTGFWLALANRQDVHHKRAVAALERNGGSFVTTWPVVTETCDLLCSRLGVDAQLAFLKSAALEAFEIFTLEREHLTRAEGLIEKYRDLPMTLADASLVILAEEMGSGDILSTDERELGGHRWKNKKPFRNLLLK